MADRSYRPANTRRAGLEAAERVAFRVREYEQRGSPRFDAVNRVILEIQLLIGNELREKRGRKAKT
jgi:hypothetical protein